MRLTLLTLIFVSLSGCVWNTLQRAVIKPNTPITESDIAITNEAILQVVKKYDLKKDPWVCEQRKKLELQYCDGFTTKNPKEYRIDLMLIVPRDGYRIFVQDYDSAVKNSSKAKRMFNDAVEILESNGASYSVIVTM